MAGYDIQITDETAATKYNYWIESCFNTTTTDIWFRVPSLSTGNTIFYCYSPDTELLTEDGWKNIKEFVDNKENIKIATLNQDKNLVEYQSPSAFFKLYHKGKLFHQSGKRIDFLVTPNHRVYAQTEIHKSNKKTFKTPFRLIRADELPKNVWYRKDFPFDGEEREYFILPKYERAYQFILRGKPVAFKKARKEKTFKLDDFLKFFGIWIAEGSLRKNGTIAISQSNIENRKIIKQWIEKLGYKITLTDTDLLFCDVQLNSWLKQFGRSHDKYIPNEFKNLSKRQLKILLDALMLGDGSIRYKDGSKECCYATVSKRLADDVQEILLKAGFVSNIRFRSDIYWLYFGTRKIVNSYNPKKENQKWVDYDGFVYCVEVPNHIIYTRRNGKGNWNGNCYYGNSGQVTQPTEAQTFTGLPIYMNSGSIPSGYGNFTLSNGKYLRCAAWYSGSYTTSGSLAAHTHTYTPLTDGSNSCQPNGTSGATNTISKCVHVHTTGSQTSNSQANTSDTKSIVFFTGSASSRLTLDGSSLVANIIAFYSGSSAPTGWSQDTQFTNYLLSGSSAACTIITGHTHTLSGTLQTGSDIATLYAEALNAIKGHYHTYSQATNKNLPAYITSYTITTSISQAIPVNFTAFFTVLPPLGWRQASEANLRFIMPSGSYGGLGGAAGTHVHTSSAATSDQIGGGYNNGKVSVGGTSQSDVVHTHNLTITTSAAGSEPPYIDVICAVKANDGGITYTLGSEETLAQTVPTRGYTPYTPSYASAFAFVETPRTATSKATEWEIRLNSGNRLSSYKITLADNIGEFRNNVTKFDPVRIWVKDGARFDLLIWGIIEDFDQIQQDSTTFTISGRSLGALGSYRAAKYNYYETDVYNILTSGVTALSGSMPEFTWGGYINSPNKTLTVVGERRKELDVMTEICERCSDTTHTWISRVCEGQHPDENRIPNVHFEEQRTIPSEVFYTPRDVIGYELLESSRACIQNLQVEYGQGLVSGSNVWTVSGSTFTFSPATATGSMRTGSCDNTVEARTEKGTPFWLMRTAADYLYIGSENRFWKLLVDMSGSAIYTGSGGTLATKWEYSKFGTGSTNTGSWGTFSVSDETYGFNLDGETSFNVPVDWATGSFTTGSGGYAPYNYWVRVSTTGSITTGSCYSIILASLSPCVWRSTGSESDATKQYEYVYRGDITDSGSAITYADTILSQVYQPIKVLRLVARGSTYWRPYYTYYWRGFDYSGSGRYRLTTVIHRRSLEGYVSILESARLST